ncbi:MAG: hypothetical protein WEA56_07190 [Balneolaceae bacterium]
MNDQPNLPARSPRQNDRLVALSLMTHQDHVPSERSLDNFLALTPFTKRSYGTNEGWISRL